MQIKFFGLLQDSWNFIRNQLQFTLFGVGLLVLLQIGALFLLQNLVVLPLEPNARDIGAEVEVSSLLPSILLAMINVFVNAVLILNIKSINNGNYRNFFQNIVPALSVLPAMLLFMMLMFFPIAFAFVGTMTAGTNGGMSSLIMLPVLITGVLVLIKLSIISYVYLTEEPRKSVMETLKFTWGISRGKGNMLLLYFAVSYVAPFILSGFIGGLGTIVSVIIGSFINFFITIFGFRFYQVFRTIPAKL
ncbi:hypothetical protein BMT54_05575 [Pasteurellaceae bacterium 15-036681]|nr:hypothetical protein BMT54_05575 [Pasteurellaceae bacterium 15-036681]